MKIKPSLEKEYLSLGGSVDVWRINGENIPSSLLEIDNTQPVGEHIWVESEKLEAWKQAKLQKEEAALQEKAQKQAARQAKFDEAKSSGKPVLLSSRVESRRAREGREWGDYNFRVSVYAMPDGSTKENAVNSF
jgi:hypothetical protein